MFSIAQKVVVITGGSGLLGSQIVSSFKKEGYLNDKQDD
jgi:NAD(P)-dependent dehydrogenase (short-subunit alcohol dehydrogenase family)